MFADIKTGDGRNRNPGHRLRRLKGYPAFTNTLGNAFRTPPQAGDRPHGGNDHAPFHQIS
jgi:hypothetical protein